MANDLVVSRGTAIAPYGATEPPTGEELVVIVWVAAPVAWTTMLSTRKSYACPVGCGGLNCGTLILTRSNGVAESNVRVPIGNASLPVGPP